MREKIINIIYDLFFSLAVLFFFLPLYFLKNKFHKNFFEKFGFWHKNTAEEIKNSNAVWLHGVSVGESMLACRLADKIISQTKNSDIKIIISATTATGKSIIEKKADPSCKLIYFPVDLRFNVRKFMDFIKPKAVILMETELWPNLINCAYSRSVPVIVTNGRLSDKSYKRYKMFSYFLKDIINKISLFCMQSPADCKRIISLGSDKLKTKNCGNMKFDLEKTILNHEEIKCLEEWLNNKENTVLFLAGSTHPKEEKIIMDIYLKIKKDFPFLKLVIAARHVKRKNQIIQDAETKGIKINCFSERFNAVAKNDGIFLMDEIGWLKSLYSICDFTFVGGSLKKIGGHNIIEPAEFAKPVIIGPYTFNFQHIVKLFKKNNAVIEVNSITDFFDACLKLTSSRKLRNNYGMKAKLTVEENRGATDKIFNYIKDYIV